MQVLNVSAQERPLGKKSAKASRKENRIPAVVYGESDNLNISVALSEVKGLIYTPEFILANIDVAGNSFKAFVKDIQFHPVTDNIEHIDFLKLSDNRTVKVEVPVRFKGVSPGVLEGGKLIQQVRRIKIKAVPKNLVDHLMLDISEVVLGSAIRVRDIEVPNGIEIMNDGSIPVATVEVPRALKSAATAEAKEEAAAGGAPAEGDASAEA